MSVFPTGESGERGTTPPRDIKVRRITAVLLCQHTHTLSELSAQTFTVSDKFRHFSSAQQQGYIHCLVKWKKEGFVGEFPLVCGLRGFLLLICSSVIYGVMNGEGWKDWLHRNQPLFSLKLAEICFVWELICDVQYFMCLRMKACHVCQFWGKNTCLV